LIGDKIRAEKTKLRTRKYHAMKLWWPIILKCSRNQKELIDKTVSYNFQQSSFCGIVKIVKNCGQGNSVLPFYWTTAMYPQLFTNPNFRTLYGEHSMITRMLDTVCFSHSWTFYQVKLIKKEESKSITVVNSTQTFLALPLHFSHCKKFLSVLPINTRHILLNINEQDVIACLDPKM